MLVLEIFDEVAHSNHLRTSLGSIVSIKVSPPIPATLRVSWEEEALYGERIDAAQKLE